MTDLTIEACLAQAKEKLATAIPLSHLDAESLLAFVLDKSRSYLHAFPEKTLSEEEESRFAALVRRRVNQEPLAYLTGMREFWSLELTVTQETLIPRPETEVLVETILTLKGQANALDVADLGTGSGAIALALAHERPSWRIDATDISENALQIARKNAQRLRIENVSFYQGDWCTALPRLGFDIIASNPPYIADVEWDAYAGGLAFEPKEALTSGRDGLDAIRRISESCQLYLKPGGLLLIEHGWQQGPQVRDLLTSSQYGSILTIKDFSGQERVTLGKKAGVG